MAILDRPASDGAEVAAALGGSFHPCDVTDFEGTEAAIADAIAALDGLDAVVNTAGGGVAARTVTREGPLPLETFRQVVDLNLIATFNVARLAAWQMSTNTPNADDERGVIINTASIAAFEGQIGQVAYTAAKAGIAGMSLTMARDLGSMGIRVNTIAPSLFATGLTAGIPEEFERGSDRRRRVPEAHGQARRVRTTGGRHHREPDAERRHDPPRRGPALRAEVIRRVRS